MKNIVAFAFGLALSCSAFADYPVVRFETNFGNFDVELYVEQAPITVENFLSYVDAGFYNGTIIHRVVKDFVIQGGGLTEDMNNKKTNAPIVNEAGNGLSNLRGTIAMARTSVVDSATSQFFVNTVDNVRLDHRDETPAGFGYAVFGRVIAGMKVIDAIAAVKTHTVDGYNNVPVTQVLVMSVARVQSSAQSVNLIAK